MLVEQVRTIGGQVGGLTVTVKLQLVEWPQESVAVQVTVVVPNGKVLPLGGLQNRLSGAQPPEAELLKKTVALVLEQLVVVATIFDEQFNTIGGQTPPEVTVTVKPQTLLLPQASTAVQVTEVTPGGKVLPLGGLQVSVSGAQPPLAVLVKKTTVLDAVQPVFVTTTLDEQFRTIGGQVGGFTVTVKLQLV
jgi:hypothetical protein